MQRFLEMLDERFSKSKLNKSDVILRKTRKDGPLSTSLPPVNAPDWTINSYWIAKQGEQKIFA